MTMSWRRHSTIAHLLLLLLLHLVSGHLSLFRQHDGQVQDDWGTGEAQAKAAVDAMMGFYNETAGQWQPEVAWWLSGNALQTLLDYMHATGTDTYLAEVLRTVTAQSAPLPWWPAGGGLFRADSTDDTGWWALAMVRLYDLTGDGTYLAYARADEAYMRSYRSDVPCGGGLIWDIPSLAYKNAVSNALYLALTAALHNRRLPGDGDDDDVYLARALEAWRWFAASGMINDRGLVNDGLAELADNVTCANNGGTVWTYNAGVLVGGLVELHAATAEASYLAAARGLADAVLLAGGSGGLVVDGVLTESCEQPAGDCDHDQQAFKGIFARYLGRLDAVLEGRPYRGFLRANARVAWDRARNATGFFGVRWSGPFDGATVATQASAASLMLAAMDLGE